MAYLDGNGLLYVWQKIKTYVTGLLSEKVDKVDGKGLSTNDYTTAEKNKLAGLNNYTLPTASTETLGGIKVGAGLAMNNGVLSATGGGTADSVDWSNVQNRPTNISAFTNDSGYQTSAQVQSAISTALSDITGISYSIVNSLPSTGDAGVIYLINNSGTNSNVYDEYIYVNGGFEKIGTTETDLSGYLQTSSTISNSEIDTLLV